MTNKVNKKIFYRENKRTTQMVCISFMAIHINLKPDPSSKNNNIKTKQK